MSGHVYKPKQPVTETFDQPYKSKWENSEYGDVDLLTKLPDGTNLSIMFNHEGDDEWQVEFYRDNSQAVTGQGDAQRILATVINAVQKFVKKHKPQLVRFSASTELDPGQNSESRAKLYGRIIQRYASAMGYEAYQEDHGDQVTYELTRLENVTENSADGLISGKEMLDIFKRMHHEHGFNKQMERWIAKQTWSLDTIEPEQLQDMYNDDEDTDPFDRTVWLDDAVVTKYERILSAGQLVNPIIMGLDRTVIDGNHRAQAAKNLHVSIPGYVPVKNDVTENFTDGKGPGRPGDSRRHGIPKHATLAQLDKISHQGGRKGQLAHWQANMRRGRAKTNEAIAPHGDSWNELNLMKIGQKPAALVGPHEFEKLYKPIMRKYNWIWTHVTVPNPDSGPLVLGFERYIIGQPGEQARIARMHHLLVQMNKNLKNGIRPDADYHIEMGRLLGYSDADISEFLKKINL